MRFPRQARIFRGQMDAAPFAGVFILLVIFLVFKSSLVYGPGVSIDLPAAADAAGVDGPTLVVVVDRSGQMYYRNQIVQEADLKTELRADMLALKGAATVVIQADKAVSYDVIVRLGKLASEAGARKAVMATRPNLLSSPSTNAPAK